MEKEDKQRGTYKSCINPACDYLHTKELGPDGLELAGEPGGDHEGHAHAVRKAIAGVGGEADDESA